MSFDKIKKAGFYPKKKIDKIVNEFLEFYSLHDSSGKFYLNDNFFRLKVLKKLLTKKKINKNLKWI